MNGIEQRRTELNKDEGIEQNELNELNRRVEWTKRKKLNKDDGIDHR
jgi:hypothetical protein